MELQHGLKFLNAVVKIEVIFIGGGQVISL
jgi:hypothetical protein